MTYEEMEALKNGSRIKMFKDGKYENATFIRHSKGGDSAIWIAFDKDQKNPENTIETKVYTGMQFNPEYWNDRYANGSHMKKFLSFSEKELDEELFMSMGAEV